MAIIHPVTMAPAKLELLTSWLPGRPWYLGDRTVPRLTRAGGFRLDDPEGKVGLEFLSGDRLAGKLDAAADRASGVLRVSAIHQDVPFSRATAAAVDQEIRALADWLGLDLQFPARP